MSKDKFENPIFNLMETYKKAMALNHFPDTRTARVIVQDEILNINNSASGLVLHVDKKPCSRRRENVFFN